VVHDEPRMPYRGLLADVARDWHDIEVLGSWSCCAVGTR
jgi:N-acetyl-beta-hexosaminidase